MDGNGKGGNGTAPASLNGAETQGATSSTSGSLPAANNTAAAAAPAHTSSGSNNATAPALSSSSTQQGAAGHHHGEQADSSAHSKPHYKPRKRNTKKSWLNLKPERPTKLKPTIDGLEKKEERADGVKTKGNSKRDQILAEMRRRNAAEDESGSVQSNADAFFAAKSADVQAAVNKSISFVDGGGVYRDGNSSESSVEIGPGTDVGPIVFSDDEE